MEELIVLILRLLTDGFSQKPKLPPKGLVRKATTPSRAPVTQNLPSARRTPTRKVPQRRMVPPPILIAQPILTGGTRGSDPKLVRTSNTAKPAPATLDPQQIVKPSANAQTLRKWLTPQTLRQQFIITEIFQPPLALRAQDIRQRHQ